MEEEDLLYLPTEDEKQILQDVKDSIQDHRDAQRNKLSMTARRRQQMSKMNFSSNNE